MESLFSVSRIMHGFGDRFLLRRRLAPLVLNEMGVIRRRIEILNESWLGGAFRFRPSLPNVDRVVAGDGNFPVDLQMCAQAYAVAVRDLEGELSIKPRRAGYQQRVVYLAGRVRETGTAIAWCLKHHGHKKAA